MTRFLRLNFTCWIAALVFVGSLKIQADEVKYLLRAESSPDQLWHAESVLEVSGQLKLNPDGKRVIELPMTGKGEFKYHEREMAGGKEANHRQFARHYSLAKADFRIGERDVSNQLSDDHPVIRIAATESKLTLFSPTGPLTHEELELIEVQGNSAILGRLLPEDQVAAGEKWKHGDALAAMFLGLDVVTESTLESQLNRVEDNVAYLEMSGTVQGSVSGINSTLEVAAKYQFDMKDHRIKWLAMSLKEKRDVGHAEPGFDVTARIRIAVSPGNSCPELADEAIAAIPAEVSEAMTWLSFNSEAGGFRFLHDRNWHLMVDRHDVTILRLVDKGELVAQCNITRLADTSPDKQLSMTSFQADIRRVLDKNFEQFADSRESQNEKGVRTLRAVAAGVAADLPIQWNYYHLTDDHGRQVTLVFTMESSLVARFGAADQVLIDNLEILERATPPASKSAANPASESAQR